MLTLHELSMDFVNRAGDGQPYVSRFNLCNRRWKYPISLTWDTATGTYLCVDARNRIHVAHRERIQLYYRGIDTRLRLLAEDEYLLRYVDFRPGDVVVDCGANVGEVGKYLSEVKKCRVISVEPDVDEFRCLCLNNPGQINCNVALWKTDSDLTLFRSNATGDSSLFQPPGSHGTTTVHARALSGLLKENHIGHVKLFKLEAEGAEPEVIEGAGDHLEAFEYISADLGPERGPNEDPTTVPVINYLLARKFELVDMTFRRIVCLFKRKSA